MTELQFTEKQLEAISYPVTNSSVLSIFSGPGCGKSQVLANRIKHLIEKQKIKHHEILVLTTNTSSVSELKSLLLKQNVSNKGAEVDVRTFDSLAFEHVGSDCIKKSNQCTIIWDKFSKLAIKAIINDSKFAKDYSAFKLEYIDDPETEKHKHVAKFLRKYPIFNYEEIQRHFLKLVEDDWSIITDKYKVIVIDEFQDIRNSFYQFAVFLVSKNLKDKVHLTIAGDPNQSIYNFVQPLDVYKNFKAQKHVIFHEILLNQTFQTSKGLVNFFNEFSEMQLFIDTKSLQSPDFPIIKSSFCDEPSIYEYICKEIRDGILKIYNYEDILILGYSNEIITNFKQSAAFYGFKINNHGFRKGQYDGMKQSLENGFLNFCRILTNPFENDLPLLSCIMLINGIQTKTVHNLINDYIADESNGKRSLWSYISNNELKYKTSKKLLIFIEILKEKLIFYNSNPALINDPKFIFRDILEFINDTECSKKLLDINDNQKEKVQAIMFDFYEKLQRFGFMRTNSLQTCSSQPSLLELFIKNYWTEESKMKESGSINVSTIHSAKGSRYKVVFIIEPPLHLQKLKISSKSSQYSFASTYNANERRLFYAAATRSKSLLYLCQNHLQFNTQDDVKYNLNPQRIIPPASIGSLNDFYCLKNILMKNSTQSIKNALKKNLVK